MERFIERRTATDVGLFLDVRRYRGRWQYRAKNRAGAFDQVGNFKKIMRKHYSYFIVLAIVFSMTGSPVVAQDPIFSQFFSSPLSINPALAGNGDADWRFVANMRNQTLGFGGGSLTTNSFSLDGKIFRQKDKPVNYIGGGFLFLQDAGLGGAYQSNSLQAMVCSHVSLDEDDSHGLTLALGGAYSNTMIDFSQLSFSQQLSSSGFNRSLPINEPFLSNVKPYYSLTAGVTYTITTDYANFDIGVAGYRFLKTNRTALSDPTQLDPPRYNFHADYQSYIDEKTVFNANALYVSETGLNTYTFGVNFGRILNDVNATETPSVFNLGLFYRGNQAIIPYLGFMYKSFQAGLTYDVNVGASTAAVGYLKTFEFSLIFRSPKRNGRGIPCPWK